MIPTEGVTGITMPVALFYLRNEGALMAEGGGNETTPLGTNGHSLPANATELEMLQAEVNRIKQRLPSLPRWLTTAGAICGLIAALFSVVGGLWSAHVYLSSSPRLSLVAGPTLGLVYLPQEHRVTFTLPFSVANDGDRANVVTDLSAVLTDRTETSRRVAAFAATDFDCTTGQAKVPVPFTVGQGLPTSMVCTASAYVPESGRALFADGSPKQFVFSVTGQKNTAAELSYCFDLPDYAGSQLRAGDSRV